MNIVIDKDTSLDAVFAAPLLFKPIIEENLENLKSIHSEEIDEEQRKYVDRGAPAFKYATFYLENCLLESKKGKRFPGKITLTYLPDAISEDDLFIAFLYIPNDRGQWITAQAIFLDYNEVTSELKNMRVNLFLNEKCILEDFSMQSFFQISHAIEQQMQKKNSLNENIDESFNCDFDDEHNNFNNEHNDFNNEHNNFDDYDER